MNSLQQDITDEQIANYSREVLLDLYQSMVRIREFEDGVKFLFLEGAMPGTIHQCHGQEATAVGVCSVLREDDMITSTFRGHGHALAKGLTQKEMLQELFGASTGCCKGKGGSMHMGNMGKGMIPAIAIVGGGIPLAAGMALSFKMRDESRVSVCFFGDGATSEGAFHEGVNMAAIWDLPVLYVCENNLYGASTHVDKVTRVARLADRAVAYGIKAETIDGNNVLAVQEATIAAVDRCRQGKGPVMLELMTYRLTGHSRRDACHYQPKEEREYWRLRDPILLMGQALIRNNLASESELDSIRERMVEEFDLAVSVARSDPHPEPKDLVTDVFA
jgi:TPP-dependent pyruvate/acetoin dehydrogenase alpha subunit